MSKEMIANEALMDSGPGNVDDGSNGETGADTGGNVDDGSNGETGADTGGNVDDGSN